GGYSEEEVRSRAAALAEQLAAERIAEHQAADPEQSDEHAHGSTAGAEPVDGTTEQASETRATHEQAPAAPAAPSAPESDEEETRRPEPAMPSGPVLALPAQQLVDELGLDPTLAQRAASADDTTLYELAESTPGWQGTALL